MLTLKRPPKRSFGLVSLGVASVMALFSGAAQADPRVNVCAVMRPQVGTESSLRTALGALVSPTHSEAGNIAYSVFETEDGALFLYESWRSQADLDLHLTMPYVVDFVQRMPSLIDGQNDAHFGRLLATARSTHNGAAESIDAVHVCSFKRARPGKGQRLRAALQELSEPTQAEPGLLSYYLYEEADGSLFSYEVWRSKADLEQHFKAPNVRGFQDLIEANVVVIGKPLGGRQP